MKHNIKLLIDRPQSVKTQINGYNKVKRLAIN